MKTSAKIRAAHEQVSQLIGDDDNMPLCAGLIAQARTLLWDAFLGNLHEEQQEAREAADERRTMRQENGHPQ